LLQWQATVFAVAPSVPVQSEIALLAGDGAAVVVHRLVMPA
jgi:hypothetical protein